MICKLLISKWKDAQYISQQRNANQTHMRFHFTHNLLLWSSHLVVSDSATLWTAACQASLFFTISRSLLKLLFIQSVMPSNHYVLCHPLLLPSIFPASGSVPMSWLFISGGQSTEASVSASVLPMNIHGWFPSWLTRLISKQSKGLPRLFSNITTESINSSALAFFMTTLTSICDYWKRS